MVKMEVADEARTTAAAVASALAENQKRSRSLPMKELQSELSSTERDVANNAFD